MPKGTLIESLFRPGARTADAIPILMDDALFPEERAYIEKAVVKRRAEFSTARVLARQALRALGVAPVPLVPGKDHAPIWPTGVVGSISHTNDYCAVVVEDAREVLSVGLDVEALRELDTSVLTYILTRRELAWLRMQSVDLQNDYSILIFSAKEAYYKCQYTMTRQFLDFSDVELELGLKSGGFEARVLKPGWPSSVARLQGTFAFRAGKVMCGVELVP